MKKINILDLWRHQWWRHQSIIDWNLAYALDKTQGYPMVYWLPLSYLWFMRSSRPNVRRPEKKSIWIICWKIDFFIAHLSGDRSGWNLVRMKAHPLAIYCISFIKIGQGVFELWGKNRKKFHHGNYQIYNRVALTRNPIIYKFKNALTEQDKCIIYWKPSHGDWLWLLPHKYWTYLTRLTSFSTPIGLNPFLTHGNTAFEEAYIPKMHQKL